MQTNKKKRFKRQGQTFLHLPVPWVGNFYKVRDFFLFVAKRWICRLLIITFVLITKKNSYD